MVDRLVSVDSESLRFPDSVRVQQAADLEDRSTPEGAAVDRVALRAPFEPAGLSEATLTRVEPAGLSEQTNAALAATYAPMVDGKVPAANLPLFIARVSDLSFPWVADHMNGANLAPEQTMEGARVALSRGATILDVDVNLLADGSLGVMHNGTVDSTTTSTGNVSDRSAASFQNLVIDAGSWFGGGWGDLKPPLLAQFLAEFGNRVVVCLESKSQGACAVAMAKEITRFGVEESVIASTAFWADLPTLVATGAHTLYVMTTGVEKTPAECAAVGIKSVSMPYSAAAFTSALVNSFHAAGINVFFYTADRQADIAAALAKGADGFWSNDPRYANGAQNGYSYRRTTDPFKTQTYYDGHLPDQGNNIVYGTTKRGVFTAPNKWGIHETANNGYVGELAGWACPLASPTAWTLDLSIDFNSWVDTGRWAGLFICAPDDRYTIGSGVTKVGDNFYRVLLTPAGSLQVTKFVDGVAQSGGASQATVALTAGQTVTLRIQVTPTQIIATRTDLGSANVATLTDSTYRGAYFHYGVVGLSADFHDMTVS